MPITHNSDGKYDQFNGFKEDKQILTKVPH